jgi:hypothetical protein
VNATLKRAADDAGVDLELTDLECWVVDRAVELEDRPEQVQTRLDTELAANAGAATIGNLSAEVRRLVNTIAPQRRPAPP